MPLLADMAAHLPGSRLTPSGAGARLVFEIDGCWLDARARAMPVIEVFIRTLDLPGFELRLDPRDREVRLDVPVTWGIDAFGHAIKRVDEDAVAAAADAARAALSFDAHYRLDHDDRELAALWLDEPARAALVDALWLRPDIGLLSAGAVANGYQFRLARGEVLIRRSSELEPARLAAAVRAGGVLAARPHRIARAWLEVARTLGGTTTTDRWDLARDFAVTVDRSPVVVQIDNVGAPLRTRARARRLAPDAPDDDAFAAHASLLAAAAPAGRSLTADEVQLWWRGLMMDPARLGPAVEICARLAAPSIAATGPYR